MRWTPAQQQTIETRDKNILVSAAAGSGKTTVLIRRISQMVMEDRVDIDRFLITTFTNAAAAEMKEKMEKTIRSQLEEGDLSREDAGFLRRQLDLLPQASISTFHTFALGIMKDFFYLTDLEPGFVIGDETRLSIMQNEVLDDVFERRFEEDEETFDVFLRKYSSDRNDKRLKERILKVYQEMRSIPRYMQWAESRTGLQAGEHPLQTLGIGRFVLEETAAGLKDALRWYEAAAGLLHTEETGSLYLKARLDVEHLQELYEKSCQLLQDDSADPSREGEYLAKLGEALADYSPSRMVAQKAEKDFYEPIKEQVTWLRKQGKKPIDDLKKKYYAQTPEECDEILRNLAADTVYFIGLIEEMEKRYREKKRAQNMVDFDDCMHYAIEILEDPAASEEYRDRFQYIFIDEYQDSNLLQEEIVGRIARENNLFMVGDVKQSIYKFRLAEPEIFYRRYREYRDGDDENSIRIDLNTNFRSRRTVRDVVNRIFRALMDDYDEDAQLNGPEEEFSDGYPVSLHILGGGVDEENEDLAEPTEMEVVAKVIRQMLGKPIADRDGSTRPIEYGDIAVLSRGGKMVPDIERYLNNEGIPAYGETAGGYYETVEIQVFLNLLKIISNPCQDVPLISVMNSVMFDFTPRQLAQIRIECREGSYEKAVRQYEITGSDPDLRARITDMYRQIAIWKEIGRTVPLDELMRQLLDETGYYDYCSGLPAGQRRTSNLRLLLDRAAAYEDTSHLGLYGFLNYVEAMQRTRQKVSEASLAGEGRDVVHVMTVHKSKGLEFPVVILAGAGKKITSSTEGRSPAIHKAFGIGLPEVDREMHWHRKTILQKAIAGKKTRESLEEEIRILYVALTRPMEKLAIIGCVSDLEQLQQFPGKKSFLDMIYGTMRAIAEEDPSAAEVILYAEQEPEGVAGAEDSGQEDPAEDPGAPAGDPGAPAGEPPAEERPDAGIPDVPEETLPAVDPAELDRRLSFRYPYEVQQKVRTKYSVTELNRMEEEGYEPQIRIPEVSSAVHLMSGPEPASAKLTAAEVGTAVHSVMERIDFHAALEEGLPYIRSVLEDLRERGILTEEEYEAVQPGDIHEFFLSETGARAARAPVLRREQEFLMQKEIDGVPAIVQGIIDCYFEDEDGLVLIDYKNSWAGSAEEEEILIHRYAGQIRLYREALELSLGKPVTQAWLYLFRSRRFIPVEAEDRK